MFAWFKPKPAPQGPAIIEAAADIDCAADTLFGLLNFADPRCWKRTTGRVETVAAGRFRLHLDGAPDHVFTLVVSEAEPGRLYAFDTQITPRAGCITHAAERYEITPTGVATCTLRLVMQAYFEAGIGRAQWQDEAAQIEQATCSTLAALKAHAESGGVAPVRATGQLQHAA